MKLYISAAIAVTFIALLIANNRLNSNPATQMFEIHFQEGFSGETIALTGVEKEPIIFIAQSKFTTGLAHIVELETNEDLEIKVTLEDLQLEYIVELDYTKPFVTIYLSNGQLEINHTDIRPGYL